MYGFLTEHTRITELIVEMLIVLCEPRVHRERRMWSDEWISHGGHKGHGDEC
jgi:hypothetical protein